MFGDDYQIPFLDQYATNFVANYIPDFGCRLLKWDNSS